MATARTCIGFRSKLFRTLCYQLQRSRGISSNISSFRGSVIPLWDDPVVKRTLERIRGLDLDTVYSFRHEDEPETPYYKLMTDEEFLEAQKEAERKAEDYLQMPSQMMERREIESVLCKDEEYAGFDESKFVFTDISSSVTDEDRWIVVREPDGTLREARWEERERMIQIYHPKQGKKFYLPPMLQDENIMIVFNQLRHKDVLDLVCMQCAPDSEEYINIHQKTYNDMVKRGKYNLLHSTRHFGGFAFYLLRNQKFDGLLVHLMEKGRISDAIDLVKLHHYLEDPAKSPSVWEEEVKGENLLKEYLEIHSLARGLHLLQNVVGAQREGLEAGSTA